MWLGNAWRLWTGCFAAFRMLLVMLAVIEEGHGKGDHYGDVRDDDYFGDDYDIVRDNHDGDYVNYYN